MYYKNDLKQTQLRKFQLKMMINKPDGKQLAFQSRTTSATSFEETYKTLGVVHYRHFDAQINNKAQAKNREDQKQ